ncbi:MAG: protein serine/threonine phosphatase [Chitinophagaceae bacterium]|nr:protein serine/threonine phosphatase [Chitinophagaceae bacterium]
MKIIELAADTDLGKQREDNQDTFICMPLWSDDQGLIGVIDGVGGYEGGEVAAAIAKESIEFYMATPKGDALSMLKEAVVLANNQILEAREKDPKLAQMCCVLTVAVADAKNQVLYYVHVGDTRLYRFRNGLLEKITMDHSLVGLREDAGTLTEQEAMQHPRRNIILRQVGSEFHRIDDPEFLEFGETEFLPGDAILICSDGLSDMITKDQIIAVLNEQVSFPTIAADLIALANKAGGNDNITVVLAKNLSTQKPFIPAQAIAQPDPSLPEPAAITKSPVTAMITFLVGVFVLFTAFWFFTTKPDPVQMPVIAETSTVKPAAITDSGISRSPNNTGQAVSTIPAIDSLITFVHEREGNEVLLEKLGRDTILLTHPIELGKIRSLTGGRNSPMVLMPDSLAKTKSAIDIVGKEKNTARKDTVFLKNLVIQGFETGIHVEGHIVLRLDHVFFNEVRHAVGYKVIDSTKSRWLTF